jgi:hypothetical protein
MTGQMSFASLDFAAKKKQTKRDVFLAEMAAVVPWVELEALIEPHYPKLGPQGGRRPFPLSTMLRIYCLQQWYNLSDPGAEEALYDIQSMRAFAGLDLGRDAIPDETTILNFRHLLERHDLTKAIFSAVAEHLAAKGELLSGGTIVDATLIAASPSTKRGSAACCCRSARQPSTACSAMRRLRQRAVDAGVWGFTPRSAARFRSAPSMTGRTRRPASARLTWWRTVAPRSPAPSSRR